MSYTIEDFWIRRLPGLVPPQHKPILAGWSIEATPNPSFVEADLHVRDGFDDLTAPIWFVAAPGAVGKSTLAKEISARTGAVYLDLAKADTVAGNYLTGGLVKNDLFSAWRTGRTACLIDAMDEARLRVTQSSFEDFLSDLDTLARDRNLPTILFGRVGIVEEAWLILSDRGLSCPILDIDFFDASRAEKFVIATLHRLAETAGYEMLAASLASHRSEYERAAVDFVRRLEDASASDGARFAGYAPVLEAVATVLAGVTNPASLDTTAQEAMQTEVLQQLTDRILEREATKLREQIADVVPDEFRMKLYAPEEQLARLAGRVLSTDAPAPPPVLPQEYVAAYDSAVTKFMMQHPFLDGTGLRPSGAVFAAAISVYGLFSPASEMVAAAEKHAGHGPHTPNPFLIDFYLARATKTWGDNPIVPPEHVVALYESVRARAQVSDIVRLTIEGDEEDEEADVEIQISGVQGSDRRILLRTSQAGALRFGRQVNGVSVDAPQLDVVVGSGNPVEMIAPVSLNVARLTFDCPELVVLRSERTADNDDAAVTLEAHELSESKIASVPMVRKGAKLSVAWPGASSYPWANFVSRSNAPEGQGIDDALRGFRRLVLAFRSHSKGRLARFEDKIEHVRITKGDLGVAIRQRMMTDGILSLEGSMYFLDPDALGQVVGATYHDLKFKRFNERVRQYVSSIAI